jgi:pimeloyl-ACP methyl ester carboxylesterase
MRSGLLVTILCLGARTVASQGWPGDVRAPGRLVGLGGYRLHLWCTGTLRPDAATVVLSIGGGGFFVDWWLVQKPLSDSARVCSYDRPGYGWSDAGPYPRTFRQEAFELRTALENAGERSPYLLVGQSLGAFVVRRFAETYAKDVVGVVLVAPTNENGKLGYRGQWVIPRTLASKRPIPSPRALADSPPIPLPAAERDSCRARAERNARIWRPFEQLDAQAQRYRIWALQHPACVTFQDDYFAEEMAAFYEAWSFVPHPLGDVPLVVILGTKRGAPPPGLSEAELRSDSLRIDLSKLSSRGRLVSDSLSGHHVQLDNPMIVVNVVRQMMAQVR